MHVDIVGANRVDAHTCQHARVAVDALLVIIQLMVLEKEGAPRVAAFHAAVHIVPVIDHPQRIVRRGEGRKRAFFPRDGGQEVVHPVEDTGLSAFDYIAVLRLGDLKAFTLTIFNHICLGSKPKGG